MRAVVNRKDSNLGIKCPRCGCRHLDVYDTRRRNGRVVRKRSCRHCGHRPILTVEQSIMPEKPDPGGRGL
jgi:DNA-directed RNA polymerase subunit RPC12/RpoP